MMDLTHFKTMDVNMLYSIINMKLRDEFQDLDDLVAFYDIDKDDLVRVLGNAGFVYEDISRQFHA